METHTHSVIALQKNSVLSISYCLALALLIILFLNTGLGKVFDHAVFTIQLNRQPLPAWSKPLLAYLLPALELGIVSLLLFKRTRQLGLLIGTLLMASYTVYAFLAYLEVYGYVVCACGKLFSGMGWGVHTLVNLAVTLLAGFGLWQKNLET